MPTNLTNKFESQNQHHIFCCSILQHIRDKGISCKHYTIGNIIHLRGHLLRLNYRTHMVWEQCQTKMEIGSKAMLSRCETFFPSQFRFQWEEEEVVVEEWDAQMVPHVQVVQHLFSPLHLLPLPIGIRLFLQLSPTFLSLIS